MNDFLWGERPPQPAALFGLEQLPFSDFYHLLFRHSAGAIFTDRMLKELVSTDPEVIRTRQDLLLEMYQNKRLAGCFKRFSDEYLGWREYIGSRFEDSGDAIGNIDPCGHVTAVLETIDDFSHNLQKAQNPIARDLRIQLETLRSELSLDRFEEKWKKVYFDILDAREFSVGLDLDEALLPDKGKILEICQKPIPEPKRTVRHILLHDGL